MPAPDDPMIDALLPALSAPPRHGIFVPIRLGESVVGGAALLSREAPFSDRELLMAERLSEVLALTVESFRSERVIFEPRSERPGSEMRLEAVLHCGAGPRGCRLRARRGAREV